MKKNLIIYGYNCKNLGDDLMFAEVINKTNYKNYYFIGSPNVPDFVEKPVQFIKQGRLMPFRWKLKSDFAVIGGSVLMGSSLAQESMIRQKLNWFKLNRLSGGRNFIIGANLGPFESEKRYLGLLQELSHYTDKWFVRDEFSFGLLNKIKTKYARLMPDLVMGFDTSLYNSKKDKSVFISVTKFNKDGDSKTSEDIYHREIVEIINRYNEQGYIIKLASFEDRTDIAVINTIISKLGAGVRGNIVTLQNKGENVVTEMAKSDIVVATRFHAMVLAALLGKQQIIYSYSDKTTNFAKTYGFPTYTVTGDASDKIPVRTSFNEDPINTVESYPDLVQR